MSSLTRTRVKYSDSQLRHRQSFTKEPSGAWNYVHGQAQMSDSVTFDPYRLPGYKSKIARRESATTSLSGTREDHTTPNDLRILYDIRRYNAWGDLTWEYWTTEIEGTYAGFLNQPTNPPVDLDSVDNQAKMRIVSAIKNAQRQLQAGVVAGELHKTLALIRNPTKSIWDFTGRYLRNVKKHSKYLRNEPKLKRAISSEWLKYRFGVLPLISDVNGGIDALVRNLYSSPTKVVTASAQDSYSEPSSPWIDYNVGPINTRYRTSSEFKKSVRYKACVSLGETKVQVARQSLGLTIRDFVPTVWELIPYSFLVDYFSNIGKIMDAFSIQASTVKWAEKGIMSSSLNRLEVDAPVFNSQGWQVFRKESELGTLPTKEKRTVARAMHNASFMPSLTFKMPGTAMRWLNISALATLHLSAVTVLRGTKLHGAFIK